MRTDEWITEAGGMARFAASCVVGAESANREVTVMVGVGGVPRSIVFGGQAARLDGRSLARLVLGTLRTAASRVDEHLTARLGDHAGLFRSELPDLPPGDGTGAEVGDSDPVQKPIPELERARALVAGRVEIASQLRISASQNRTLVENSDGRIRVGVRGVTVEELFLADGLLPEYGSEALGLLLVSLVQGAIARSAERVAELAGELTGTRLDIPGRGSV
ncbi:hypothetical protein AB0M43_19895 [Longispora sp. NPDC051575]|uniref:hypothetical protein n=1 Tax=Longispora sp. NPDC051575 TaxID=3154943 RepID=UPI0034160EB5